MKTRSKWCETNLETVSEGYTLSKEAIIVWTMLTSAQLIKRGIRINCTLPGPTQTPMMDHFRIPHRGLGTECFHPAD